MKPLVILGAGGFARETLDVVDAINAVSPKWDMLGFLVDPEYAEVGKLIQENYSPQTNGFVERFQRTVLEEFFVTALRTTFYGTVEALQADLGRWLLYYNTQRPHQGYRNMGRRPIDTVNLFVNQED